MKALTLTPPWGNCIALHGKDIENRTWVPPTTLLGQTFAIHQGKAWTPAVREDVEAVAEILADDKVHGPLQTERHHFKQGVVAVARFAGVIDERPAAERISGDGVHTVKLKGGLCNMAFDVAVGGAVDADEASAWAVRACNSIWWCGPVGWLLADVRRVAPVIECSGAQGLWTLPEDVEAELRRRGLVPT